VLGEEDERALDEGGHGRSLLIVVELDESEARAVVDDRVCEVVADSRARLHPLA
jgi:hypothetical protein